MFALRRLVRRQQCCLLRQYSSSTKLVEETQDNETGISTITLSKPPVNSLNLELLTAIKNALLNASKEKSRGVILTSSLPTVFSAGLDITEMYKPDPKRAREFWGSLQDTWAVLYSMKMPVAAAINGNSPAGGCVLALSCEYRVFVEGKYTMGLNETKLGIVAPEWFQKLMITTIGYRQAELALLRGTLFSPKEALDIGLVDELATDKADAIKKCTAYIQSYAKIAPVARAETKRKLRLEILDWLKENKEADTEGFINYIMAPQIQTGLQMYMEALKKKKQ